MRRPAPVGGVLLGLATILATGLALSAKPPAKSPGKTPAAPAAPRFDFQALQLAIADLTETFGPRYPRGKEYLARLEELEKSAQTPQALQASLGELNALKQEALLANPLLAFDRLVLLNRKQGQHGLPVNHKCNSGIERTGYDNEISVLSPVRPDGRLRTLYRPAGSEYVGEIDLHWDAGRLLFTMPVGETWEIFEIAADGSGLRQVSRQTSCVDNFDPCYLPDGGIAFASTASFHAVPCWHGKERACAIYRMNADGTGVRQLCFDQDLDLHPAVLPDGQVVYSRWDYSGIMHMYLRPLMAMNPDGTNQRAVYGSNSYWPNALYYPRGIPGVPGRIIAIAAGYHGPPRMGVPVLLDVNRGGYQGEGVVQFVPGRNTPVDDTVIKDEWYATTWPKYLHPYPLAEPGTKGGAGKYFLLAMQPTKNAPWGIYLADVFDNVLPICVLPGRDLFEPIPLQTTPRPPVIPDRVDLRRKDAVVYLHDVYAGPGLAGVPRGTVQRMRIAAYHFGYPNLAGPDKVGLGGPWEVMRILGTVPVRPDGSAMFRVPANTPLTLQPLDAEGKAVQLMRTWYTAMPGEVISCVGCHEPQRDAPPARTGLASRLPPSEIEPWHGPARGFDFEREVQPVLDAYCVSCHNGQKRPDGRAIPDLRALRFFPDYRGHPLDKLGDQRLHPDLRRRFGGARVRFTPSYEVLVRLIRRVGIEDDVHLLVPGEYHADTSELVQMLRKGHHGVRLDAEAWDRLATWIDLNGPCHGTWGQLAPIPDQPDARRRELAKLYGSPNEDFEAAPALPARPVEPVAPAPVPLPAAAPACPGWPFDAAEAHRRQLAGGGPSERTLDLGDGVTMRLVRIPAGQLVMGGNDGPLDERPAAVVRIDRPFWMGATEVTNRQFHRFDPTHFTGYFMQRYPGVDGPGLALDAPDQPVVRVSWEQAEAFCRRLSERTGLKAALPTEAQWEYACRAGTDSAMSFGSAEDDFSAHANLADRALAAPPTVTGGLTSGIVNPVSGIMLDAMYGGDIPCSSRGDDRVAATAPVGRYRPNAWGLFDMHGNAAEWTRSAYRPYPWRDDGRDDPAAEGRKVVRGGSFRDRPARARSAFRVDYPAWQRVHDAGFRIVIEDAPAANVAVNP